MLAQQESFDRSLGLFKRLSILKDFGRTEVPYIQVLGGENAIALQEIHFDLRNPKDCSSCNLFYRTKWGAELNLRYSFNLTTAEVNECQLWFPIGQVSFPIFGSEDLAMVLMERTVITLEQLNPDSMDL